MNSKEAKPICLVTGSSGLVGSESVRFFSSAGYYVIGVDNDMRKYFFGEKASTQTIADQLVSLYPRDFKHYSFDIRNRTLLEAIFKNHGDNIKCIIHCAGQPSHDWAAKEPHTDFDINAGATLALLELTRQHASGASFIFMSTNKVYGDTPNTLDIVEQETRYEIKGRTSIDESMSVDRCKHSLFGVSKLSADMMVQEYGRYFGMNTVCFRAGCITGPNHQGAELHGFLSYLVKCIVRNEPYRVYGYKGKQVRDNIHAYDLVSAFWEYHKAPKPAAVYNIGGGRENSLSILETIEMVTEITGRAWTKQEYVDEARAGDHIWYISDLSRLKADYQNWSITYSVKRIVQDIVSSLASGSHRLAPPPSVSGAKGTNRVVTASLQGGIGNQLFLIALAYASAKRTNRRLLFLKNQFSGCRQGSHPSTYYDTFYKKVPFTEDAASLHITEAGVIKERSLLAYDVHSEVERNLSDIDTVCFFGYFQSDQYFKEYAHEVKELFTPDCGFGHYMAQNAPDVVSKFPELFSASDRERENWAFIGVRRGDFVTHAHHHNPCGMTYYKRAMRELEYVRKVERYYVLTDDFAWAKRNFRDERFHFLEIDERTSPSGMIDTHQLMVSTLFKHYIISNSTFYWWGSFLSSYSEQEKFIYAPDKWTNGFPDDYKGCYRDRMRVLERPVEVD